MLGAARGGCRGPFGKQRGRAARCPAGGGAEGGQAPTSAVRCGRGGPGRRAVRAAQQRIRALLRALIPRMCFLREVARIRDAD